MKIANSKKILILLIVLAIIVAVWFIRNAPKDEWHKKSIAYSFVLKNTSSDYLENLEFEVFLPMDVDVNQKITSKSTEFKNSYKSINKISPYGTKIINFTLDIEKNNKPMDTYDKTRDYLSQQSYMEVTDDAIKSLAKQLKAESTELTAKNIYNWLVNNIASENYSPESRGAAYTLNNKQGDCTEFTYLFIALARANGIPARGSRGLYIPQQSLLVSPMDYHDWAEFYDGDNWIMVDAQKQFFNQNYSNYLTISWFTDVDHQSKRFSISNNKINVSFQ